MWGKWPSQKIYRGKFPTTPKMVILFTFIHFYNWNNILCLLPIYHVINYNTCNMHMHAYIQVTGKTSAINIKTKTKYSYPGQIMYI